MSKNAQLASENTTNTNNEQRIGNNNTEERLVVELRQGVERIIAAVRNYTIAFEALVGMRGMSSFPFLERCHPWTDRPANVGVLFWTDEIEGAYKMAFLRQGL